MRVLRSTGPDHARAIGRREDLSPAIIEALVGTHQDHASRRTGEAAWHSDERKAEKSCSPASNTAASRIRASSSSRKVQPLRPASSGCRTGELYSR